MSKRVIYYIIRYFRRLWVQLKCVKDIPFFHWFRLNTKDDRPDIQFLFSSAGDNTDGGTFSRRDTGLTDDFYSTVYEPILYHDSYTIIILLLRPKSRGKILLKDKNPLTYPLIYPNYFEDPLDTQTLVRIYVIYLCN